MSRICFNLIQPGNIIRIRSRKESESASVPLAFFQMNPLGKLLIISGIVLVALGLFVTFGSRFLPLGRLPGDIVVRRGNSSFYFPIVTCIIISILLSLILRFFHR